jgi:two-component system, NarL family, invasion response regulator UvrY
MSGVERRARVLVVDDHAAFLTLLTEIVNATSHLELAGEAQSGERAVELAKELAPDMVVMDVLMPGIGGLEAAERIKAVCPPALVVLVSTTHPDELPPGAGGEVIWKCRLGAGLLDEIWRRHCVPADAGMW